MALLSGGEGARWRGLDLTAAALYRSAMREGQTSRTALGAAGHRAAHQALEGGRIFLDPLALAILGDYAGDAVAAAKEHPEWRPLRLFIAMRSRFAEDAARRAIQAGVRQIVALGAGLDTFAYRLQPIEGLRVFELDHPATQSDKRRRLAEARIAEPPCVAYVGHDFAQRGLTEALEAGGLDPKRRAFVFWLGVTPYLTEDAVFATLGELRRFPGGAEMVFDYANPLHAIEAPATRALLQDLAARVAAAGEPFRCTLVTSALHERARRLGWIDIEDLDRAALSARCLTGPPLAPRSGPGGHVVRMATRLAGEG